MAARCLVAATLVGLALAGCSNVLPRPDYVDFKTPASYRTEPGGGRVDNASYTIDAEGYRVDPQGARLGIIDVPAKKLTTALIDEYLRVKRRGLL